MKSSESAKYLLYHSQDLQDLNSAEDNLDLIIFKKMDLILNQEKTRKIGHRLKSPIALTAKKKKNNLIFKIQEPINKRITLGKFLMKSDNKKKQMIIIMIKI